MAQHSHEGYLQLLDCEVDVSPGTSCRYRKRAPATDACSVPNQQKLQL